MTNALHRLLAFALTASCLTASLPLQALELAASSSRVADSEKTYPALTSDTLFSLIASEIAVQRNFPGSAFTTLLHTAETTGISSIAKRAFEIASLAGANSDAGEAAILWEKLASSPEEKQLAHAFKDIQDGRYDEAEPVLAQVLAKSRTPARFFEQIFAAFNHKRAAEALPVLERLAAPVLNRDPSTSPEFILARLAIQCDNGEKASSYGIQAIQKAPLDKEVFKQAIPYVAAAAPERAAGFLKTFLDKHPEESITRLLYARVLMKLNEQEEAQAQAKLVSLEKLSAKQWFQLGALAEAISMPSEAMDFYQKGLGEVKGSSEQDVNRIYFRLATLNEQVKRASEAIHWYSKIQKGELFIPSRIREAALLSQAGQVNLAIDMLSRCTPEKAKDEAILATALADLMMKQGEARRAYEAMKKAAGRSPSTPSLLYDTALLAEQLGLTSEAEFYLRKSLAADPSSPSANNALGYLLANHGKNLPEALRLIERANAIKPHDPFILDSLGWVWHRLGNAKKARSYLSESLQLRYDPETAAHLAEVEEKLGNHDAASTLVQSGLEKHPGNKPLLEMKKRLHLP